MLFRGAQDIFRAPSYEQADCGDSEDRSVREAGVAHVAKALTHCDETTQI